MGSWEKELQEYIYYIRLEKKLSDNTVEAYIRDLRQMAEYLEHEFSIRPQQAEERHIEAFLAHLYDKGVKKTTQARILSGIKSFYYYLLINDRIENLPTEFIDPPKTGRKLPDVLSVAEIESIIHTFDSDTRFGIRNKAMVETLYSCGLRVSELITLRLSDLFFNDGFIRVIGKGDKQRLVPISETARHRIEEYLLQRQTMQTDAHDADIVFLRETEAELLAQIKDRDMMFIKERLDEHNLYERAQRNINIGFVLMRCNEASLKFWEEIRSRVISKRGWDQEETNMLLLEQPDFIKWGFFTDDYCNGGDIKKETVKKKAICTSCGTVARRHFLSKEEYLIKMHNIAIGKSKVWLDGSKM